MTALVKSSTEPDSLAALQQRLGHEFSNPRLLELALTHASTGPLSNERLEFLGDRVLGLTVAEKLYEDFPDVDEGGLAVRFNALVRRDTCAKVARMAGLGPHIIMAASESEYGGRDKSAILAGACEAVIAAIYLDGGMEAARRFIMQYWGNAFLNTAPELRDAKTALQEWAQSGAIAGKPQPVYRLRHRAGPDHAPIFTIEVTLPGHEPQSGEGNSKREAEQAAARRMLLALSVWK
jgi:ribonuclease-3